MYAPRVLRKHPQFASLVVAFAMLAAACTSGGSTTTIPPEAPVTTLTTSPPTTTTSTTLAPTTTTTTTDPTVEVSASITGLPGDESLIDRRVIAVKIDNHPKARPQSGLDIAEIVYEILVEGQTRFIALYQQTDLDYVGPNRSGRPTDGDVLKWFDPVFQISGAQPWVRSIFRSEGIRVVYDNGVATYRISSRSAPQNLYMSTIALREYADSLDWADDNPGNLFTFGEPTEGVSGANTVTISYLDNSPAVWEFDGERYLRSNGSTPHEWVTKDGESGQVAFETILALTGRRYVARDPSGQGSSVPATDTVGAGDAYVFTGGSVVTGTWSRDSTSDPFVLMTPDGEEIVLPPSRIWISIVPDNRPITWE